MTPRTVFIHGRPGPHPFHAALARSVKADFLPVDFLLRWQDRVSSRPRRYLSWLLCALCFPRCRRYDVFLTEGPQFPPLIMKWLRLLRPHQKVVGLMANETLYFLKTKRYPKLTHGALIRALRAYDALICVGQMQADLARGALSSVPRTPRIFSVSNCVPSHRRKDLSEVEPYLNGRQLLFIGSGSPGWRAWYKGFDLLLEVMALATSKVEGLRLSVVGEWPLTYLENLASSLSISADRFLYQGRLQDLRPALSASTLYVHFGRGDAFPTSILESMCAGVPALVSEWTGAREAVRQVDPRLVVPLDSEIAAERICWYMNLPLNQKADLSARSREVAAMYTEERAVKEFREAFSHLSP